MVTSRLLVERDRTAEHALDSLRTELYSVEQRREIAFLAQEQGVGAGDSPPGEQGVVRRVVVGLELLGERRNGAAEELIVCAEQIEPERGVLESGPNALEQCTRVGRQE